MTEQQMAQYKALDDARRILAHLYSESPCDQVGRLVLHAWMYLGKQMDAIAAPVLEVA